MWTSWSTCTMWTSRSNGTMWAPWSTCTKWTTWSFFFCCIISQLIHVSISGKEGIINTHTITLKVFLWWCFNICIYGWNGVSILRWQFTRASSRSSRRLFFFRCLVFITITVIRSAAQRVLIVPFDEESITEPIANSSPNRWIYVLHGLICTLLNLNC